ncbi:MAG TPA: c-type cytochrome [Chitinophagaceae bacterium]|nr:c-type cytochrome [Chitinophagaceae bacterium]
MKPIDLYKLFFVLPVCIITLIACNGNNEKDVSTEMNEPLWRGWNKYQIPEKDTLAKYGRELIEKTAHYLGPKGIVAQITNGMNCQNCHLDAGTVPWGNNYGAVASMYPQFRARSGGIETIVKRISDCMERSLNGKAVDSNSKEMKAIIAYMTWLGDGIPKNHKPKGSGIMDIPYLDRAADPLIGKTVYINKCQRCHGADGQGQKIPDSLGYVYPPLWGPDSYTTAAGLFRISRFAGFVKNNMPFGEVAYHNPLLTNEEAWDVAAFVNSQPRPVKIFNEDWPDISKKPFDHPFGPYADSFSEAQHKYGPFIPILKAREENGKKNAGK